MWPTIGDLRYRSKVKVQKKSPSHICTDHKVKVQKRLIKNNSTLEILQNISTYLNEEYLRLIDLSASHK